MNLEELWLKHYNSLVPRHAEYPNEPLPVIFKKNLEKWAHRPAIEFYGSV